MFSYPSDYSYSLQDLGENLTNEDVNGDFGSGAFYPVQWGVLPAHVWCVMDKGFLRFGSGRLAPKWPSSSLSSILFTDGSQKI